MINKNQAADDKSPMIEGFHTTDNRMSHRPAGITFQKTQQVEPLVTSLAQNTKQGMDYLIQSQRQAQGRDLMNLKHNKAPSRDLNTDRQEHFGTANKQDVYSAISSQRTSHGGIAHPSVINSYQSRPLSGQVTQQQYQRKQPLGYPTPIGSA